VEKKTGLAIAALQAGPSILSRKLQRESLTSAKIHMRPIPSGGKKNRTGYCSPAGRPINPLQEAPKSLSDFRQDPYEADSSSPRTFSVPPMPLSAAPRPRARGCVRCVIKKIRHQNFPRKRSAGIEIVEVTSKGCHHLALYKLWPILNKKAFHPAHSQDRRLCTMDACRSGISHAR